MNEYYPYQHPEEPEGEQRKKRIYFVLGVISAAAILICVVLLIGRSLLRPAGKPPVSSTSEPTSTTAPATEPVTDPPATEPPVTEPPATEPPVTEPPAPPREYEYVTDVTPYLDYITTTDSQYLILANRSHALGEKYVPSDLVKADANPALKLRKYANEALNAMLAEMKAMKMADCSAVASAYRDFTTQYKLYNRYLAEEKARHPDYTDDQIRALVDSYSARPGTSDHQTGLTIDFYPVSERFETTKTYRFMMENAYKFGFILRFPEDKTDITGYMFESWHWRFVGREAATYIYENGITLEEYLGILD